LIDPNPFTDEEKTYLKFLAVTTLLTVAITTVGTVAAEETKGFLARRREAKAKRDEAARAATKDPAL
jgi:hypothetical protein